MKYNTAGCTEIAELLEQFPLVECGKVAFRMDGESVELTGNRISNGQIESIVYTVKCGDIMDICQQSILPNVVLCQPQMEQNTLVSISKEEFHILMELFGINKTVGIEPIIWHDENDRKLVTIVNE